MKGFRIFLIFLSSTFAHAQQTQSNAKVESTKSSDTTRLIRATSNAISNKLSLLNPNDISGKEVVKKLMITDDKPNPSQQTNLTEKTEPSRSLNHEEKALSELGEEYTGKMPRYFGLIIGISKYKFQGADLPSLDYPTKDANRIKQVLIDRYGFDVNNMHYLENPVRSTIIDAFEQLSGELKPEDNLLIFYAGHGYYDKEKKFGYWLPADAKSSGKSEWISNTTIRDYLGVIQAKHTLLISDACFSGSIFKSRGMGNMIQKIGEMYKYPSRRAMTSGNLSLVPDKSFFADYLIKRLNENTDTFLPSQTLFYRIYEPVTNNSPATPQFGVVQETGDEGGDFVFIRKGRK